MQSNGGISNFCLIGILLCSVVSLGYQLVKKDEEQVNRSKEMENLDLERAYMKSRFKAEMDELQKRNDVIEKEHRSYLKYIQDKERLLDVAYREDLRRFIPTDKF